MSNPSLVEALRIECEEARTLAAADFGEEANAELLEFAQLMERAAAEIERLEGEVRLANEAVADLSRQLQRHVPGAQGFGPP